MFSSVTRRIAGQSCWLEIKRNISKGTSVVNSDALTRNDSFVVEDSWNKSVPVKKYNRTLSTLNSTTIPVAATSTAVSKDESRDFMAVFPDIIRGLTEAGRYADVPDATKWLAKVMQYNVPRGKKNRGLATVLSYKMLAKPEELTPDNLRLAIILGWCVEMFQASFLVLDDLMDSSETRRGMPCWYKTDNIGISAVNDGLLIEAALYSVLKKHFRQQPYYVNLLDCFHDSFLKTTIGQSLDLHTAQPNSQPKLELFTMNRYNNIVKYKTAYYSFHLPVALAMYMAGNNDPEMHRQAKTILLEMGHFFQIQDDFLDCFGDPHVTGKKGTDIQDGKCSWLAVVALQRVTPKQRKIMEECYGSNDPKKVATVKELYVELGLPHTYSTYEEESFNMIKTHIQQISRGMPCDLFFKIMEKIYRREC